MSDFEQYPDDLYVMATIGGETDDDGFAIPATEEWVFHSKCRNIENGSGNVVSGENGENTVYSSKIVMPSDSDHITAGSLIKVEKNSIVIIQGRVIRYAQKQLHNRLWV